MEQHRRTSIKHAFDFLTFIVYDIYNKVRNFVARKNVNDSIRNNEDFKTRKNIRASDKSVALLKPSLSSVTSALSHGSVVSEAQYHPFRKSLPEKDNNLQKYKDILGNRQLKVVLTRLPISNHMDLDSFKVYDGKVIANEPEN